MKLARTLSRPFLGELLLRQGLLDAEELTVALERQRRVGGPLGKILVELGLTSERTVTQTLSRQLNVPTLDLDAAEISPEVTRWVDPDLAERFHVFPVSADPKQALLRVVTANPSDVEALEMLTERSGMMVFFFLAEESTIVRAIRRYYPPPTPRAVVVTPPVDQRVEALERAMHEQGLAVRGMLELLDRKGVVDRGELLGRLLPGSRKPPPLPIRRTSTMRWLPLLNDD